MSPRPNTHFVAMMLCVVALVVAQAFGGRAGYLCICSGDLVPTQASHCYGPHGVDCHSDDDATEAAHREGETGEREDHQSLGQEVQLRPVEAAAQIIAPQVLLAILPIVPSHFAGQEALALAWTSVDSGDSPPFGLAVARTIVLRI